MSPVTIHTRGDHLIGLLTAGVLSVAAWEFGEWLLELVPAPQATSQAAEMGRALAATVTTLPEPRGHACACRIDRSLSLEVPYAEV